MDTPEDIREARENLILFVAYILSFATIGAASMIIYRVLT